MVTAFILMLAKGSHNKRCFSGRGACAKQNLVFDFSRKKRLSSKPHQATHRVKTILVKHIVKHHQSSSLPRCLVAVSHCQLYFITINIHSLLTNIIPYQVTDSNNLTNKHQICKTKVKAKVRWRRRERWA